MLAKVEKALKETKFYVTDPQRLYQKGTIKKHQWINKAIFPTTLLQR